MTKISSFLQIRASIPLFWRNTNLSSIKPKFEYLELENISYLSSYLHFNELRERYNCGNVCILNLIRQKEGKQNENTIGEQFRELCSNAMDNKKVPIKRLESINEKSIVEELKFVEKDNTEAKEFFKDDEYNEGSESENENFDQDDDFSTPVSSFTENSDTYSEESKGNKEPVDKRMISEIITLKKSNDFSDQDKSRYRGKAFKSVILNNKDNNSNELLLPNICFLEFDFLDFKKKESEDALHDLLKLYANGFIDKVGFYFFEETKGLMYTEKQQQGVIRVNCIDCLDRTNYSMTFIAACALYRQITSLFDTVDAKSNLEEVDYQYLADNLDKVSKCIRGSVMVNLSKIYSQNGDAISRQYCGSKAMHATSMTMNEDGSIKVDKRNDNSLIFTKRYFNNVLGKDMKKQSCLCLVNGHFKYDQIQVHPWKIDFMVKDVNFDSQMQKANVFQYESIFDKHLFKARELEMEKLFDELVINDN